jgi:hypothetical protein
VAYVSIARATAMFAVAGESTAISIVSSMTASMRAILNAQMKGIWKVTAIIAGVAVYYNQQSQKLPGMKAMTGETPEFTQALNYDTASGGLAPVLPKLDTGIEQPSPFPKFGW